MRVVRWLVAVALVVAVLASAGVAVSADAFAARPPVHVAHVRRAPAHARRARAQVVRAPAQHRRRAHTRPVAHPKRLAHRKLVHRRPPHGVRARIVWRVRIPAIHVSAAIVPSGVNRDGTIAVPSLADVQKVGWYEYGAVPGHPGPAVLMGHVDTLAGRAVFFRLYQIRRGDLVDVQEGGPPLVFAVTSVREVSKRSFPTSLFALNGPPVLYLVTCAGAFDYVTRHYEDNIIVTARLLTVPRRPAPRSRVVRACVSTVTSPQHRHINHNRRTVVRSRRPASRDRDRDRVPVARGAAARRSR